jgi:hypothetical protein
MITKWRKVAIAGVAGALAMTCLDLLRSHGYLLSVTLWLRLAICGVFGAGVPWVVQFIVCRSGKTLIGKEDVSLESRKV